MKCYAANSKAHNRLIRKLYPVLECLHDNIIHRLETCDYYEDWKGGTDCYHDSFRRVMKIDLPCAAEVSLDRSLELNLTERRGVNTLVTPLVGRFLKDIIGQDLS